MKIAQVNPGCGIPIPPPNWGAIEKIVWEFMCNLKDEGHQVDLKWCNEIRKGDYDVVMVHVANLAIELADRGIPYIFQHHDHHAYHHGKDSSTYRQNLEAMERSLVSLVPARHLVEYFDTDKVIYFSHGVNTKDFYPAQYKSHPGNKPKLLMVANNGLAGDPTFDRKGFEYGWGLSLLSKCSLTIAGPSHNKEFFNSHLHMLNHPKLEIKFDTPNSELLNLYHKHDIFLNPTMLEAGHPNLTMIEAAAAGLPIIANWELETDFDGAWRAPRNVFEMYRGLLHILENWETYKENAIKTGNKLSWKNRTKELIKIFEQYAH